jgi:hypothetical protein
LLSGFTLLRRLLLPRFTVLQLFLLLRSEGEGHSEACKWYEMQWWDVLRGRVQVMVTAKTSQGLKPLAILCDPVGVKCVWTMCS